MLAIVAALATCLLGLRVVLILPDLGIGTITETAANVFAGFLQDILLCCLIAAAAWTALWPRRMRPSLVVYATFIVAVLAFGYGVANIAIVRLLGEPVTIDWLRYSDFLSGAINGILHFADAKTLAMAALVPAFLALLSAAFALLVFRLHRTTPRTALGAASLALAGTLVAGAVAEPTVARARLDNPVIAFFSSVAVPAGPDLDIGAANSGGIGGSRASGGIQKSDIEKSGDLSGIRNVILFVLESVPAEYVYDYSTPAPVTPNINRYGAASLRFNNVYAHAPATNYSLFSLLTSIVPELSSTGMTEKHPDLPLASVANVLSERGYRTAYISSSDSRFQSTDLFLANKGFDVIEDFRDWSCDRVYKNSSETWRYMDFSHDLCTVDRLKNWIAEDATRPFFATFWTGMTHYPYFADDTVRRYVANDDLNRFLNALNVGDAAFGELMRFLEASKLADSTLVVIVGDHGEAFGQHGTYVHASAIYEENIHVPLIFVNAKAFSGQRSDVIGGNTDVAPTILDLLGVERPALWQGASLLATERPGRLYFFSPWNGFKVGYREGNRKYIYNSRGRTLETYDLASDPKETHNLTPDTNEAEPALQHLASWVRYQDDFIEGSILGGHGAVSAGAKARSTGIRIAATGTSFVTPPRARVEVDGATVGFFDVAAAPKNADKAAADDDIAAALTVFEFPLPAGTCPSRVRVEFLNDEWDAQKEIGDTNLFVKEIDVNGVGFSADDMAIDSPDAAARYEDYMALWRQGSVHLDVDDLRVCG
ncbi:sulfatase-like hydrolase/transferase [Mesorhizobium sp. ZMM04-5]|uniref:Sulfatase-like hydrolase/transferase n=1 Tax=Mesorhizobium marinum TaxID=3228790 RepID=A0ABV3R0M0_9HYPH